MTTLYQIDRICRNCTAPSQQTGIGSTNSMGSPDLDLRPPEMQRSTMPYWLEQCPRCGYVGEDISAPADAAIAAFKQGGFDVTGLDLTGLSRRFHVRSVISERIGDPRTAAGDALCSAWTFDDAGNGDAAVRMRARAADLLLANRWLWEATSDDAALTLQARLIDILRRAKRFDEAAALADALAARQAPDVIKKIAAFHKTKSQAQDAGRYTVSQAAG